MPDKDAAVSDLAEATGPAIECNAMLRHTLSNADPVVALALMPLIRDAADLETRIRTLTNALNAKE